MRNKGIVVALLILLMVAAIALPAFARGPICERCDEGELKQKPTVYTPWETIDFTICQKNPNYNDKKQQRFAIRTWTCNNCGVSEVISTTEYRILCEH